MTQLTDKFTDIIDKTSRLIALCQALSEENESLKLKNKILKESYQTATAKNIDLEESIQIIQLAQSLHKSTEKDESTAESIDMKKKISNFVNEIDKCILLLKKQH